MPTLPLTPDDVLATTRSVRKRLDFNRLVEREVIEECLRLAQQAPTGSNNQGWHFVIVTDPAKRAALGELYLRAWDVYLTNPASVTNRIYGDPERAATQRRVASSAQYLADHMHEAPVLVIPCIAGRAEGLPVIAQAGRWGSIIPAVWSFMLAARARGLGTCLTTIHLLYEEEAARLLGIPYAEIMQAALIPVAYTLGTDFQPAPRTSLETITHWEGW